MAGNDDWRKNADTHKTAGHNPGGVNPRRNFPYNPYAMAAAGIAVVGGLYWYMYNRNNKPEARHRDVGSSPGRSGGS